LIRLVALMKSFLELGGLMLTMTGVDRETMEKAQREPEKYQNLRVRLGGLSAYFIALSKEVQDSLIKRTKHTI
jgi:pyruvate-formate lyase